MTANTWITHRARYDRMLKRFSHALLKAAAPLEGESVVDIGCGTGSASLVAAGHVGPTGRVLGIDIDPEVIDVARSRAVGVDNVSFVAADAATYAGTGAGVEATDVVISRFGTMSFVDPGAAFGNLAGMLKPGGRMAIVVWQSVEANLWHTLPMEAVLAHVDLGPPRAPDAPGPFALADPDRLTALLSEAGLGGVALRPIDAAILVADDIDDALAFFDDDAGAQLRSAFGADAVDAISHTLSGLLAPYASSDGVRLPASAWLATAKSV